MKPCIQAPGCRTPKGYGKKLRDGKRIGAHRAAYIDAYGPIPDGLPIDHTCHNVDLTCPGGNACLHRGCIEPTHLEAVSTRINVLRGRGLAAANAAKTHCDSGHEFTAANTCPSPGRPTERHCRKCFNRRRREQDARASTNRRDPTE